MINWNNTATDGYPPEKMPVLVEHDFDVHRGCIMEGSWLVCPTSGCQYAVPLADITHWSEANRPGK